MLKWGVGGRSGAIAAQEGHLSCTQLTRVRSLHPKTTQVQPGALSGVAQILSALYPPPTTLGGQSQVLPSKRSEQGIEPDGDLLWGHARHVGRRLPSLQSLSTVFSVIPGSQRPMGTSHSHQGALGLVVELPTSALVSPSSPSSLLMFIDCPNSVVSSLRSLCRAHIL